MAVPSSGAISLNQFHVEAGGGSGTQCSMNDSDIRGLIGKGSGVQMGFNEWYGAAAVVDYTMSIGISSQTFIKTPVYGAVMPNSGSIYQPMGSFNGGASFVTLGGKTIKAITTQTSVYNKSLQINWSITSASEFTSFTFPTSNGAVTILSSSFSYSNGFSAVTYTGNQITSGTVTLSL